MFRALDLFCGAGGATRGLQNAGFHVTGVDVKKSPRYCGDEFIKGDALTLAGPTWFRQFDFVWASPPCQAHTALKTAHNAKSHVDLIPQTRALLEASGVPYVVENVEGAPLRDPVMLCGTMFGLGTANATLRRHRIFEASFPIERKICQHSAGPGVVGVIGIYGGHVRNRRRNPDGSGQKDFAQVDAETAMGIDWMTLSELSQAIPPAYSEFIARQWLLSKQLVESA